MKNKKVNSDYDKIEYYDINGIPVLVFCSNNISYINYTVNDIEYNITLDCDYETACQIAKTL